MAIHFAQQLTKCDDDDIYEEEDGYGWSVVVNRAHLLGVCVD